MYDAIRDGFDLRNTADYGTTPPITEDRSRSMLQTAEQFVQSVTSLLERT
jgi:uncharacterized protein (UPF0332 family)